MDSKASFWKKYGYGVLMIGIFILAWAIMTWADWSTFVSDQLAHHQPADVFGPSGYIWQWGTDTFSNWQADLLWQGVGVMLGAYLIFRGSSQSMDTSNRIEELTQRIEREVRGEPAATEDQARTEAEVYRGGFWRNRGLAYVLIIAGLVSWALMTWMGWMEYAGHQQQHGESASLLGTSGYMWYWLTLTFENWQSDILGHAALVILPAYLLYKNSVESRDGDDKVVKSLQRIQQSLESRPAAARPQPVPGMVAESRPRSPDPRSQPSRRP